MLKTLHISGVGRLSLALAIVLSLVAAGGLLAARHATLPRGSGGPRAASLGTETALAQGIVPTPPGQPGAPPAGITVSGEGEVTGTPDVAYLSLGVQTEGKTAREAMDANSAAMSAVIDAVKRAGIPEQALRTTGVNLVPITTQPRPGDQAPPQIAGYRASNTVAVTVDSIAKVGEVLDAAVGAGANVAGGLRFAIKDEAPQRRRAREMAAQSARTKAEALAAALGLRLTGVQAVVDEGPAGPIVRQAQAATAEGAQAVPVQPGELTVRARVRIVFSYA